MRQGIVWAIILGSLWFLHWPKPTTAQRWIVHTIPNIPGNSVNDILLDSYGNIWVGTEKGLARFDGAWLSFHIPLSLGDCEVRCLKQDQSGNIWIGTSRGLIKINPVSDLNNPGNWRIYTTANTDSGLISDHIRAIAFDHNGNIWIGTDSLGVCTSSIMPDTSHPYYDPLLLNRWAHYSTSNGLKNNFIKTLEADAMDNIWVSNGAGIDIFDAAQKNWINNFTFCDSSNMPVAPTQPTVPAIFQDNHGILWLGTENHGLYKTTPGNLVSVNEYYDKSNTKSGLASNRIWDIAQDQEGVLWIAHNSDYGISLANVGDDLKNPATWKNLTAINGLAADRVTTLAVDAEQNLWFGHQVQCGISQLDREWLSFLTQKGASTNYINHLFLDSKRRLWVATDAGAVRQACDANLFLDQSFSQILTRSTGLSSSRVFVVFQDSRGFLWFGTDDGADRVAMDSIAFFSEAKRHFLPRKMINCFAEDHSGHLWLGTNSGLYAVHLDSVKIPDGWKLIKNFNAHGPIDAEIHALLIDWQGNLWVGTQKGISRYDHHRWLSFQPDKYLLNANIHAIAEDSTHFIWFGTEDGLLRIDPRAKLDDAQNWQRYSTDDGLASNYVTAICEFKKGELWCGTAIGATRLEHGESFGEPIRRATTFNLTSGLTANFIWTIMADPQQGDLWIGTRGGGISRYRPQHAAPQTYLDTKFNVVTTNLVEFRFHGADDVTHVEDLAYQYRLVINHDDMMPWQETPSQYVPLFLEDTDRPMKYIFQVRAIDRDGNIDPTPDQTEFVKIDARAGGAVELSTGDVHIRLLLPPGLLAAHHQIRITPLPQYQLSDTATVIVGFKISGLPEAPELVKPVTLSISFSNPQGFPKDQLAIYQETEGQQPVGGTTQMNNGSLCISTIIFRSGIYVVRSQSIKPVLSNSFDLNLQPRIFSPAGNGRGHGDRTTISFFLNQESQVGIKIYNSAGRLAKTIKTNPQLPCGYNAIDWDGTDDAGNICDSGLYIVTVTNGNKVHQKTVLLLNKF